MTLHFLFSVAYVYESEYLLLYSCNYSNVALSFERVHPVVFVLMYWIYLLPSTQQLVIAVLQRHVSTPTSHHQATFSNNTAKTERF
jgi:hypothetical protein